jgi:hypothetical protein
MNGEKKEKMEASHNIPIMLHEMVRRRLSCCGEQRRREEEAAKMRLSARRRKNGYQCYAQHGWNSR